MTQMKTATINMAELMQPQPTPIVAYIRVSTGKQGLSGLGLVAQMEAIERFAEANGMTIIRTYEEVETGKGADALEKRPELRRALDHAKKHKATIVVAKLDRLGRNVHFISGLMVHKVPFVVCNLGLDVPPFMLHIYAAVAEQEALMISERTSAALAAAKARGTKLGNPQLKEASARGNAVKAAQADEHALRTYTHIKDMRKRGITTLRAIAAELNRLRVPTANDGTWGPRNVNNVILRVEKLKEAAE
jgi:DNA invertase Pin-like site-specific DNA recombinase